VKSLRSSTPTHCPTCTAAARPGERWCRLCGRRLNPTWWSRWGFRIVAGVVVVTFLASARLFFTTLWDGDVSVASGPEATTTTIAPPSATLPSQEVNGPTTSRPPAKPPTAPIRPATVGATATANSGQNSCGEETVYDASYTIDGNNATGWRVKGDGVGAVLTFQFSTRTRFGQIGLLPGYAKVDPCSGADRFSQLRRILKVRWTFDDGTTVEQSFAEKPEVQLINVDATATTVTLEILATTSGPELDYAPISEVSFLGAPA